MENSKTKTEEKAYTANEVGAMVERFDEKLSVLAESMDTKFEGVNSRLDKVNGRLGMVETKIDRLQDDMVEVKFELRQKVSIDQFQRLEKRVTKLERISLVR